MNHVETPPDATRTRFLSVASVGVFLIAISEMNFMASPFAAYFYSAYSPVLKWTENHSYSIWLTDFFVPHLSTPGFVWLRWFLKLPLYMTMVGLASFVVHAAYLYWTKFVRKTVATALLYRFVRHPQYLSFAVAGIARSRMRSRVSRPTSLLERPLFHCFMSFPESTDCSTCSSILEWRET